MLSCVFSVLYGKFWAAVEATEAELAVGLRPLR